MSHLKIAGSVCLSPFKIGHGRARFFQFLLLYFFLSACIFGAFSYFLYSNQDWLKQVVMDYLFPSSWQRVSEWLIEFFFESQTKIVLIGMITNGSLVIASIFLFPLKEHCSALFEIDLKPKSTPPSEFPLWLQALEETKLLFVYVTAQSVIFAIGYYPYEWANWLSSGLSIFFLCFTFGLDFIAPTLQRHRTRYNVILKLLVKHVFSTLIFGAIFALPVFFLGQWLIESQQDMGLATIAGILFLANLVFLSLAIPAGTYVATNLKEKCGTTQHFKPLQRYSIYVGLGVAFLISGFLHYLVGMSMHHKSQILKCDYDIDWSSISINSPSLGKLIKGEQSSKISFDLVIHNPTSFDLTIEKSNLYITREDKLLNKTNMQAFSVASGQTIKHTMQFETLWDYRAINSWSNLSKGWQINLEFELLPGIPYTIKILQRAEPD